MVRINADVPCARQSGGMGIRLLAKRKRLLAGVASYGCANGTAVSVIHTRGCSFLRTLKQRPHPLEGTCSVLQAPLNCRPVLAPLMPCWLRRQTIPALPGPVVLGRLRAGLHQL